MKYISILLLCLFLPLSVGATMHEIEVQPNKIPQGGLCLVTVTGPSRAEKLECLFAGKRFEAFPSPILGTDRIIVGCSWDTKVGPQELVLSGRDCLGSDFTRKIPIEITDGKFRKERLRVAKAMATPPQHVLARIARESKLMRTIFAQKSFPKVEGAFVRPIPGIMVSPFGSKRVFNGQVRSRHSGVDLRGGMGRAIKATNSGKVVLAQSLYYAGTTVILDHGLGLYSLYAHLQILDVEEGEFVERGQVVGRVGATGRVTGPHLHWGMKLHGMTVNPMTALKFPLIPGAQESSTIALVR